MARAVAAKPLPQTPQVARVARAWPCRAEPPSSALPHAILAASPPTT